MLDPGEDKFFGITLVVDTGVLECLYQIPNDMYERALECLTRKCIEPFAKVTFLSLERGD